MKKIKYILYIILLSAIVSCSTTEGTHIKSDFKFFKIGIEQNDKYLEIINSEVTIEKVPFKFIIYFLKPDGINIHASFTPINFDTCRYNPEKIDFSLFKKATIEEGLFNKEKTLNVSTDLLSYWNYTGESEHKFSEIEKKSNIIICKRDITQIKNIDSKDEIIELNELNVESIYMIFIKSEWNKDFTKRIEMKRFLLKLNFKKIQGNITENITKEHE